MESSGSNKAGKETARHGDSFSADLDQLKRGSVNKQADARILESQAQTLEVLLQCCYYWSVISTLRIQLLEVEGRGWQSTT